MSYTYDQLKGMTVAQLREIAAGVEHEAVHGYTQLNKEHLLVALAKAFNLDTHTRHKLGGIDKAGVKSQMKALKKNRDAALDAHDHAKLKQVRRELHSLRRSLRKAATAVGKHKAEKK
jgi:uncharacterized protein YpiB (UPF0302 family)